MEVNLSIHVAFTKAMEKCCKNIFAFYFQSLLPIIRHRGCFYSHIKRDLQSLHKPITFIFKTIIQLYYLHLQSYHFSTLTALFLLFLGCWYLQNFFSIFQCVVIFLQITKVFLSAFPNHFTAFNFNFIKSARSSLLISFICIFSAS